MTSSNDVDLLIDCDRVKAAEQHVQSWESSAVSPKAVTVHLASNAYIGIRLCGSETQRNEIHVKRRLEIKRYCSQNGSFQFRCHL